MSNPFTLYKADPSALYGAHRQLTNSSSFRSGTGWLRRPLLSLFITVLLLGECAAAQSPFIKGVCPTPIFSSSATVYHGTFFLYGGNFPQDSFVTTNGALLLYNNPTVNSAGTLVQQDYQIGGDNTPAFDLWVNTPPNGNAETTDTTALYSTEPLYSLCGQNGTWVWTAPNNPYCPSDGACPYVGYIELGADLYNITKNTSGSVSMSYAGGQLSTSVNLSGLSTSSVSGYPNVQYGYEPAGCTTAPCPSTVPPIADFTLPTQIYKFPDAWTMTNYLILPPSKGNVDLAFDIWITKMNNQVGICADDVELMIWLYNSPSSFLPAGQLVDTFNLPTFMGGSLEYPNWQAYVGKSGSGGGTSCPPNEKGKATVVSLLLQPSYPQKYIGVSISNAITAMIDTLVTQGWTASILENYYVNDINFGSEFGCGSQCQNSRMSYNYNLKNYCFAIGNATYNWSDYVCPASVGIQ